MAAKREQKQTESGMDKEKCKKFYVKFELMMCVVPSMFFELSSAKIGDGNMLKQKKKIKKIKIEESWRQMETTDARTLESSILLNFRHNFPSCQFPMAFSSGTPHLKRFSLSH